MLRGGLSLPFFLWDHLTGRESFTQTVSSCLGRVGVVKIDRTQIVHRLQMFQTGICDIRVKKADPL